jgi:6-pyruvoyltetrahydropterin/6-carboxytetrahydropterin synthase
VITTLLRRYELEVAHMLTAGVPERHKCRRLHGHRYVLTIGISGEPGADGMLIEYANLDRVVKPIVDAVDHHCLNEISGVARGLSARCSTKAAAAVQENPTVENLLAWFADRLQFLREPRWRLCSIRLEEDSQSSVEWRA